MGMHATPHEWGIHFHWYLCICSMKCNYECYKTQPLQFPGPVWQAVCVWRCSGVSAGDSDPSYLEIAASDRPDAERCQPDTDSVVDLLFD